MTLLTDEDKMFIIADVFETAVDDTIVTGVVFLLCVTITSVVVLTWRDNWT